MGDRQHERVPYSLRVQFRKASSLLVAYSVNLSRGGLFLGTEELMPVGSPVTLEVVVPGAGPVTVTGRVSWLRETADALGPRGLGVEFDDLVDSLGGLIDELVAGFSGVNILLVCADQRDRKALSRMLTSIVGTAEVVGADDDRVAIALLGDDVDVVVVDVDEDERSAESTLRAARARTPPVPAVALASTAALGDRARAAGAEEVVGNPPLFAELRTAVVRALGKPSLVRG